jgi:hypothetical protein
MSKFADYLRANGATEDEIKILDTPTAQRAYDKMVEEAGAAVAAEKKRLADYQVQVDDYYAKTSATAKDLENKAIVASAEAARAKAALLEAQRQGLLDVAKDLGYTPEPPANTPPANTPPNPKWVTADDIMPAIESAGDGLAAIYDAANEHARLFPNVPFNARELRRAAVTAKKSLYDYWEEKFEVRKAREAYNAKQQSERDDKLRAEGEARAREKFASEYGNPATRPPVPSSSPFVIRKTDDGTVRQPWMKSEDENSNARVRKATENLIKRGETGVH